MGYQIDIDEEFTDLMDDYDKRLNALRINHILLTISIILLIVLVIIK